MTQNTDIEKLQNTNIQDLCQMIKENKRKNETKKTRKRILLQVLPKVKKIVRIENENIQWKAYIIEIFHGDTEKIGY